MHSELSVATQVLRVERGDYEIYIDAHNAKTPWIIRYPDQKSAQGFNEIRVTEINQCRCVMKSVFDEFIEGKLGRWKIGVVSAGLTVTDRQGSLYAQFEDKGWYEGI